MDESLLELDRTWERAARFVPRFIADAQVNALLSQTEAINALREAYVAYGEGQVGNLPDTGMYCHGSSMEVSGAILAYAGFTGVIARPSATTRERSFVHLFSSESGNLIATVESTSFASMRIAAATALAAKSVADPEARSLLVFGSDETAACTVKALLRTFDLAKVRIVDQEGEPEKLAQHLAGKVNVDLRAVSLSAPLIRESKLIVLSSVSSVSPIHGADVAPGTFVAAVGANGAVRQLDDVLLSRTRCLVTDDRDEALRSVADLLLAAPDIQDSINAMDLAFLLCSGGAGFLRQPEDITVYRAVGMGLQDVALARAVWMKAAEALLQPR